MAERPTSPEERQAAQDLAESLDRYRLVADYTYDWEYWKGPYGELRWMSPSCERITGHPPQAFLDDPALLLRIVHADDRPLFETHLQEDLEDRSAKRLQFRVLRPDGQIRWVEHICQPVFAADGSFAGRRASTRDITEAKHTEERLIRRECELASLAENSPDLIVRIDPELRHLYVNAAWERATGRSRSDLLGRTHEEMGLPPVLCERWPSALREVIESGEPRSLELALETPEGERHFSLRAVPERGADGTIESVLCTARDETARRDAEARERSLATVVETSADFIGVATLEGQALYLNRAGQALVGLSGDRAVLATRVEDYLFPEDRAFARETVFPQVLREGRWAGEARFRHFVTGEPVDVHWAVVRIDDPDTGRPLRFATVTRDIRESKAHEAALKEANRRKDEFLAFLGHELRNPMAPIRNAVEILRLLKTQRDPRIDWAMDVLDRQTGHLSRLLDDLLDVSRIVRGKLPLERRPVALREVVRQAADGVLQLMAERRHRFDVELPAPDVQVEGDPVRLSQVLLNLLINAAHYTPEGGEVRLSADAEDGEICLRIADNGPGIPPERIEALFTPFSQGESPAGGEERPSPGGLGLGLTIAKRLTDMHGGRLEIASHWPNPGTELRVCLPRLRGSQVPRRPEPADLPEPQGRRSDLHVLVVDDNPDVAGALAMLLGVLGYPVETAHTGTEALAMAADRCPRIALLDIGLPDMDGLELARRMRRLCAGQPLYLVAVTGYGHEEARQRSFAAGFDEHLAKPVDRKRLQDLLGGIPLESVPQ